MTEEKTVEYIAIGVRRSTREHESRRRRRGRPFAPVELLLKIAAALGATR